MSLIFYWIHMCPVFLLCDWNVFKWDACFLSVASGRAAVDAEGRWDANAYSNPLLDIGALNSRGACSTQGWLFLFLFFFFPPLKHLQYKVTTSLQAFVSISCGRCWSNEAAHNNQRLPPNWLYKCVSAFHVHINTFILSRWWMFVFWRKSQIFQRMLETQEVIAASGHLTVHQTKTIISIYSIKDLHICCKHSAHLNLSPPLSSLFKRTHVSTQVTIFTWTYIMNCPFFIVPRIRNLVKKLVQI